MQDCKCFRRHSRSESNHSSLFKLIEIPILDTSSDKVNSLQAFLKFSTNINTKSHPMYDNTSCICQLRLHLVHSPRYEYFIMAIQLLIPFLKSLLNRLDVMISRSIPPARSLTVLDNWRWNSLLCTVKNALKLSKIEEMPMDILLDILDRVPISSAAAFSICSPHIKKRMRNQYLQHLNTQPYQKLHFLELLANHLSNHVVCELCLIIHHVDNAGSIQYYKRFYGKSHWNRMRRISKKLDSQLLMIDKLLQPNYREQVLAQLLDG